MVPLLVLWQHVMGALDMMLIHVSSSLSLSIRCFSSSMCVFRHQPRPIAASSNHEWISEP
jgi:hypothetical protein